MRSRLGALSSSSSAPDEVDVGTYDVETRYAGRPDGFAQGGFADEALVDGDVFLSDIDSHTR